MSIKRLLATIDKPNLVPMIKQRSKGDQTLAALGQRVIENHNTNVQTMASWTNLIRQGMDVAKLETAGASYPWEQAANYKSPLISEAVRQFGDRAKTEIMSSDKLVACKTQGIESEEKNQAMDRIEKHMNWQINTEMSHWRQCQTRALYTLAACGSFFKKTFYDSTEGCNRSRIIKHPNFSIHQECESVDDGNFTEVLYYYPNDIWERKASKIWDVSDNLIPGLDSDDSDDQDNYCFLEQCTNYDLDGDGYDEPLIVTIHKQSGEVVRIVPRYDIEGIHVYFNGNTYNLKELVKSRTSQVPTNNEEYNMAWKEKQIEDIEKESQLVRIVPEEMLTYYGFVEPIDGSFLSWGYLHLLSSAVKGVNKSTNALLNAGELANLQGGWLSKEHRDRRSGKYSVKPGNFQQTNISAGALANSVFPLPFKEPSGTLLALNQEMKNDIKVMSAKFNTEDAMKSGVSAASVLGALQEGIIPTSSLIMNVVNAMSYEFKILFRLNAKYTEPLIYQSITGIPNFDYDYQQALTIKPTANAMHSNQMQRIALAEAQLDRIDIALQVGANPAPIIKGYYDALGTPNMDEIFPTEMTSEEETQRKEMLKAQEGQLKALEKQNEMLQYQLQLAKTDTDRRVFEAQTNAKMKEQDMQLKVFQAQTKAQKEQAELQQKAAKLQNEITMLNRKALTQDVDVRMKMQREVVELQQIKADTLKRLAEVDKIATETAAIEQTLSTGDVNAIQSLSDEALLTFIGA